VRPGCERAKEKEKRREDRVSLYWEGRSLDRAYIAAAAAAAAAAASFPHLLHGRLIATTAPITAITFIVRRR